MWLLFSQRFCLLKKEYMESFEAIFAEQYETIHRLETNKLRNVARLFAHLLYTDSVPWSVRTQTQQHELHSEITQLKPPDLVFNQVLECIKMSEETTTSSSRIFVKILFQELCAYMGLPKLNQRLKDSYALFLLYFTKKKCIEAGFLIIHWVDVFALKNIKSK